MQKPPEHVETEHLPLAVRWARMRACYRMLNLASHHVLGFTIKLVLLVYFGFALLFLFLRYAILPNIDYYKGYIEQAASRASGSQVAIARIYASWQGLRPNLFLADVSVRDGAGRQVLLLPSVSATLSWWSVLGKPRFESLEISRPDLDVRRGADGKLWVAGHYIDPRKGGDGKGADWLLAQREVVIRDGRLHWTDGQRGAPELLLENVNFVMRNQWQRHRFALRATPPAALAGPLDLRADFSHPAFSQHPSDVTMWKGELYADLQGADLAAWKAWIDYPLELQSAKGALRAWLSLDHARLAGVTADVGLRDVAARLAPELPLLDLVSASGRISASEVIAPGPADGTPTLGARGHTLALDGFALATRDGLVLPPTTLSERYVAAGAGQPASTSVQARLLDLRTVSEVALRLPLGAPQRQMLAELDPRGRLLDFSAEWRGALPAPQSYHIKGRVDGLGMTARAARPAQPAAAGKPAQAAVAALPGFDKLSASVDASEQGGSVRLAAPGLVLRMPAWFAVAEMPFDQLNVQARWSFVQAQDRQLRIDLDSMDFQQQGLTGTLQGSHLLPLDGKGPGTIDLNGTASHFDVKTIGNYLPLHTPEHLRAWLTGALEDGLAQDVTLRLRGDLAHFPFGGTGNRGEFRVAGKLEHAKLNYAPGQHLNDTQAPLWPQAENIQGSFLFDRTRMEIRGDTATTGGVALDNIKAVIPDLATHDLQLEIDGGASGSMTDYLKYVAATPVLGWISHFTDQTTASGNARLALKLRLPLQHLIDAKVEGALQLQGNDIVLFDGLPVVSGSTGKIEFSERGVNLNALAGTFVGGPVAISGGSQPDNSIQVRLAGTVTADGLRKTYPTPMMQRLAGRLSGGTRYTGLITERERQLQVLVEAPLTGVGLDFPAPMAKAPADSLPLRFLLSAGPANEAGVAHDDIKVSIGNVLATHYQRQKQGKGNWTLLRGGIGVNQPAPEPDSGLMLNVSMKALDVDAWTALGGSIAGAARAPAAGAGAGVVAADGDIDLSEYVVPDAMAAQAAELILGERKLQNVVVGASHQKGVWQANIDAAQISGYLTWNDTASGQGRLTARLSSLIIPASEAAQVQSLLEGKDTAQSIPSLDIVAERFELFNTKLGRLELQAVNVGGPGREWRVDRLALDNPDGALKGSGKWVVQDGHSDTSLKFGLDIKDAGKLLDRFGFVDTVAKGKGTLNGSLAWKGLPYSLDIPSLSGNIRMDVVSGQFLKQDPGAAKLLGVLSLQALPRLLKLDFHDVFSEGLAFDGISATASIMHGVVQTNDLKMHGVAATVLMDGSADIANESTNLHVVVIPEFNLGTGPLVYGLAVNPVIGIGGFLAQLFLRAPVMKALTYQMQIVGPWKAPVVTKLDNAKLEASDESAASAGKAAAAKNN